MQPGVGHTQIKPELEFVASVSLKIDNASSVGETPDGVRMQFSLRGIVDGPKLKGRFEPGTLAYLRIDRDGVGTINVRAPLVLNDGAFAELEATGRYDFGEDGYSKARQGPQHLPDSDLGWCPRLVTMDARYLWLNRTQFLGVGKLVPSETRVDYDLYAVNAGASLGNEQLARDAGTTAPKSLYERLGQRDGLYRLMSASIDSLHGNEQLNRQNAKLAAFRMRGTTNPTAFKQLVTDFMCKLTGGGCNYQGRSMPASHAHLDITDADWKLFIDDMYRVMTRLGIGSTEQHELVDLMTNLKSEIVKQF
jgi:hemoglobin